MSEQDKIWERIQELAREAGDLMDLLRKKRARRQELLYEISTLNTEIAALNDTIGNVWDQVDALREIQVA